jgi:hypothetical protein
MTKTADLKGLAAREVGDVEALNKENRTAIVRARDPRFIELLERLRDGQSIRGACGSSRLPRRTLYDWMDTYPEIKEMVEEATDEGLGTIEVAMMQATSQSDDKDWRALSWMMARRFPQEYGDKKEVEITAKKADGIPEVIAMIEQTNVIMEDHNDNGDNS